MVFTVVMYGCESWTVKKAEHRRNWCFWTAVLEKTLESPLDWKKIQSVNRKGYQSWIFIGRTNAEAETPILWQPDMKNWVTGKDPNAGKDWRQEEKGMTEDEMVGWHHQLNGHEFEETLGVGVGQGSLVCFSPWSLSQTQLSYWTELNWTIYTVNKRPTSDLGTHKNWKWEVGKRYSMQMEIKRKWEDYSHQIK